MFFNKMMVKGGQKWVEIDHNYVSLKIYKFLGPNNIFGSIDIFYIDFGNGIKEN